MNKTIFVFFFLSIMNLSCTVINLMTAKTIEKSQESLLELIINLSSRSEKNMSDESLILESIQKTGKNLCEKTDFLNKKIAKLIDAEKQTGTDRILFDSAVIKLEQEGDFLFRKKLYGDSLHKYEAALCLNPENTGLRSKRLMALYFQNSFDSGKHRWILNECENLRKAGFVSDELLQIEKKVLLEEKIYKED